MEMGIDVAIERAIELGDRERGRSRKDLWE